MSAPRGRLPELDLRGLTYARRDHRAAAVHDGVLRLFVVIAALGAVLAASCCLGRRA